VDFGLVLRRPIETARLIETYGRPSLSLWARALLEGYLLGLKLPLRLSLIYISIVATSHDRLTVSFDGREYILAPSPSAGIGPQKGPVRAEYKRLVIRPTTFIGGVTYLSKVTVETASTLPYFSGASLCKVLTPRCGDLRQKWVERHRPSCRCSSPCNSVVLVDSGG